MNQSSESAPRPFYGWQIVAVGIVLLAIFSGIGFYSHAVFLNPLHELHGWSKGTLSAAISLFFFVFGLAGVPAGLMIDRYGARPVLVFGSAVFGLGLILLSRVTEIWQLAAVYCLLAVGFAAASLLPVTALVSNWFIRRRGQAMSFTMTGLSIGAIILVPLSTFLLHQWGLFVTLPLLGLVFWVICIPVTLLFVVQRPSDLGQRPDGDPEVDWEHTETTVRQDNAAYAAQYRRWTRNQAMRTLSFWAIAFAFLLALGAQMAFVIHQIAFLGQYLGPTRAAFTISLASAASIVGRLLIGTFVDRVDKRLLAFLLMLLQAGTVLALAHFQQPILLYLGATIFGLTMGSVLMLHSLITAECFGLVSFGTVFGLSGLFVNCGSAFGPVMAGVLYDLTQSYQIAFTIFAGASTIAAVSVLFARPPASETDNGLDRTGIDDETTQNPVEKEPSFD
jgi:MFS family permease